MGGINLTQRTIVAWVIGLTQKNALVLLSCSTFRLKTVME